ncbi:C6 finger domain protein GliZ-like, putative [Talaromyces stipitatus ATCC 10500]|uniref:C6 finger domain protein GliZ-like, putative n=1 Tax=Talaromyces stipitatus (strain ATCC 10500 / CBS 375.48 / QM 6759 / NRRL 1006) TaxID=441959 RepID=B8MGX4_TALSN|nr:C6 finger domain protein GliZ-like, putative [Talaromyces stipitatus ATCC 10500]EED16355.1 C6 finger domain protein GliZ-like, putative [Talaromyces stipitatus ATCC 10500]
MKSSLQPRKLRLACDTCHQAKTRCSGGMPCTTCQNSRYECVYSISNQLGRPKGTTKNRRENSVHASNGREALSNNNGPQQQRTPPHSTSATTTTATTTTTAAAVANFSSANIFKDLTAFDNMLPDASVESNPGMFFANGKGFPDPIGLDLISNLAFNQDRNDLNVKALSKGSCAMGKPSSICSTDDVMDTVTEDTQFYSPDAFGFGVHPLSSFHHAGTNGINKVSNSLSGERSMTTREDLYQPQLQKLDASLPRTNTCSCLQDHADLLCRLGELENSNGSLSVDVTLMCVQQALVPWKQLSQCKICNNDDDQGVLILSAMTIRAVLRRLQRLCAAIVLSNDDPSHNDTNFLLSLSDGGRLVMGKYEVPFGEQIVVTYLLISYSLAKIRFAVLSLKSKLGHAPARAKENFENNNQPSATYDANKPAVDAGRGADTTHFSSSSIPAIASASEDTGCMHAMLRGLDATVEAVGKALQKANISLVKNAGHIS